LSATNGGGYDRTLNLQLDVLKYAGCKKQHIFTDQISGSKAEWPGLTECLKELKIAIPSSSGVLIGSAAH